MALTLNLYQYGGDTYKVNKTLSTPTVLTGEQVDNYNDLLNPSFIINKTGTAPQYNYCYVASYNRYYWITRTTWVGGTAYQIDCHVDVLKTYQSMIALNYGMIAYSSLGTELEFDDRLNYKDQPTRSETISTNSYPAFIADYDSTDTYTYGTEPLIAVRYYYLNEYDPLLPSSRTDIRIAIMSEAAYIRFIDAYLNNNLLDETDRVQIGKQIIDVSKVYYLSLSRVRGVTTGTPQVVFRTPKNTSGLTIDMTGTGEYAYIISTKTMQASLGYALVDGGTIAAANYWSLAGKYETKIPYVGDFVLKPSQLGINTAKSLYYAISVDLYGMQYIVTPTDKNDGTGIWYFEQTKRIPIKTGAAFPVDEAVNNFNFNVMSSVLGGVGTVISEGGKSGALGAVGASLGAALGAANRIEMLSAEEALSWSYQGNISSAPEWTPSESKKLYNIKYIIEPDTTTSSYWNVYGKPDHERRMFSTISGYCKCEDTYLTGFSTATKEEIDEIDANLKRGVWF